MKTNVNPNYTIEKLRPESDEELDSGPIVVLNLLKLKTDSEELLDEYLEYAYGVISGWGAVGMEPVYAGKFGELAAGGIGDWDYMLLVHYPNRRTFFDMMVSEEYAAIHSGRQNSMKMAILWISDPIISFRTPTREYTGGAWQEKFDKMMAK